MKFAPSRRADRGTFYRVAPVTGFGSPIGPPHLSPPRCRQHQELKGQPGGRHRCRFPHRPDHRSHLPMRQCPNVHCWGQAHRQLWDNLRHAGPAVEVFAVAWDQQHLDRTQRLLQTWTRGAPPLLSGPLPGLGMIDDFHLWGSRRCRRMGETATTWRCLPTRFMFSTTTMLLSQRAEPSPLSFETFPKRRMGRGITRNSRVPCEKAKRGGASHVPPSPGATARRTRGVLVGSPPGGEHRRAHADAPRC